MSLTVTHTSLDVTPRHQLSLRPRCYLERVNVELPPPPVHRPPALPEAWVDVKPRWVQ